MISKYKLKISGKNIDYFIHLLISKGIKILELAKYQDYFIIVVDLEDYKKIKKIKTSYKITVLRIYGVSHLKNIFNNYLSFIICFFICCILIFLTSCMIFDIEIITSSKTLTKQILEDLKVRGVYKYQFKVGYNRKNQIIKEILAEEKDTIEWLEIEEVGTKYIINVVERVKNKDEDKCTPTNIVAKKDAFVTQIEATSGEVMTAINRSVKKGDVLISGNIFNKEEIVSTRCAKGRVFGEVWYQVYVDLPKHYHEENVTGRSSKSLGVEFFNHKSKSSYKTYKSKDINILNSKILPIRFYYTTYMETKVIDKNFTLENVDSYAIEAAEAKLINKLGKDDEILHKKILKKEVKDSRIIIGVFFKVREDITKIEEISIDDLNKYMQEEE